MSNLLKFSTHWRALGITVLGLVAGSWAGRAVFDSTLDLGGRWETIGIASTMLAAVVVAFDLDRRGRLEPFHRLHGARS